MNERIRSWHIDLAIRAVPPLLGAAAALLLAAGWLDEGALRALLRERCELKSSQSLPPLSLGPIWWE